MITLDFSRINEEITAQEAKLAQMRKFLQVRTLSFAQALSGIVEFLSDRHITDCKFSNVYSSGMAALGTEYADTAVLIIHCEAAIAVAPKNKEAYAIKLEKAWAEQISAIYNISIGYIRITETSVKLELFVK